MKKFLVLLSVALLLPGCRSQKLNTRTSHQESSSKLSSVELQLTKQEKAELSWDRWKNADDEVDLIKIINAGLAGDRGALYVLGSIYQSGKYGVAIDHEAADSYFIVSASLGFAPSIDKVRRMYLYQTPNLYLMMVYLKLTLLAGHNEFAMSYQKLRNELIQDFGQNLILEIERIAVEKQKMIQGNLLELKCNTAANFIASDAFQNITSLDSLLNNDYWYKIYEGDVL